MRNFISVASLYVHVLAFVLTPVFASASATAELDGSILSSAHYDLPAFEDSGFLQRPDIQQYYDTVIRAKYDAAAEVADLTQVFYSSDGLSVKGFIIAPKEERNFVIPLSGFPILVFNRGGNRDFGKLSVKDVIWLSRFAARGYVVVATQYRGVDGGEGQDEFGGKDVDDVLNILKLAKELPQANPSLVYMMGHSRGGMETYLALKADPSIKAAAVLSGECDLKKGLIARPDMEPNVYEEIIPDYDQDKDAALEERSACDWAGEIHAPVYIFQGSADTQVEPAQADEMANALSMAGVPFQIDLVQGEDHGFYFTDQFAPQIVDSVIGWFEKYTK